MTGVYVRYLGSYSLLGVVANFFPNITPSEVKNVFTINVDTIMPDVDLVQEIKLLMAAYPNARISVVKI